MVEGWGEGRRVVVVVVAIEAVVADVEKRRE